MQQPCTGACVEKTRTNPPLEKIQKSVFFLGISTQAPVSHALHMTHTSGSPRLKVERKF